MNAFDSIVAKKPRENAGPLAANRFAYQLDWGLKKLLELEESNLPYTIIFDYQDDILILDSDYDPNFIDFYQVKTNASAGGWSRAQLTKASSAKTKKEPVQTDLLSEPIDDVEEEGKYSMIAKLLIHSLDFVSNAHDYFFVTNANFGRTLIKGREYVRAKKIGFSQLTQEAQDDIRQKIKNELPDINESAFEHLHFIKNQMSIDDHETTIIGFLTDFLNRHIPKAKIAVRPVYDTLMGEIRKRNDHEAVPNSVNDLVNNKAFTKTQFHQFLKGLETFENIETKKSIIQEILLKFLPENAAIKRKRILKQIDAIKEGFLVYDNHEFLRLYKTIDLLLDKVDGDYNEWECSQKVLECLKEDDSFKMRYNDEYLTCLILYEMC
ncbi:MAG: DUF4297 domain-containing protein [Bacteroidaceae bacterium]|nr:DUF4297 domain-containing protein [Bacteroidaceae bacterium]